MSFEVTTAFVQQYADNVQFLLQQRGSRLRETCMMGHYTGKSVKAVEQIGAVVARERTTRHDDTPLISTPHDARWVNPRDFDWADLIDTVDKLRMIIDPTSPYAINGGMALGRKLDDIIIEAAGGASLTGENGSTSTAFDTTNQRIASGSVGLTVSKLRDAREILAANEVDFDMDPAFIICSAKQINDLLGTTEVTNSDYNTVKALVQGDIDTFMGFKFIRSERLETVSSERRVLAYVKSGMHIGMWNDISTRVSERADKNYSWQVYVNGTFGSTRVEEKKIVDILCAES